MARRMTLLHLHAIDDEAVWRTALASHNAPSVCIPGDGPGLVEQVGSDARLAGAGALVVDVPSLTRQGLSIARTARRLQRVNPDLAIFVRLPAKARIDRRQRAWGERAGLAGLLPGTSAEHWRESLVPAVEEVLGQVGRKDIRAERIGEFLRVLDVRQTNPDAGTVALAHAAVGKAEALGVDLQALAQAVATPGGVEVRDRTYRGKTYRACFVASDAVTWIAARESLSRPAAVVVGQALQSLDRVHHVVREQAFADDFLFFRFGEADGGGIDLDEVARAMGGPGGVDIADRSYLGKTYPGCFVGTEAVDWLCARYSITVGAAEAAGQRLMELGIIAHVVDAHGFVDARYFYRFAESPRT